MITRRFLLGLTAAMALSISNASAVTVLSITGSPDTCASTGGNSGNRTTGIVAAHAWTQTSGYSNVTISAALNDLGTSPFNQYSVFLTRAIGPGTTTAQEVASGTVTVAGTASPTATLTTLFTGLTLPPGSYFLTIYGDVNGPALGPQCWTFSTSAPTIVTAPGVSNLGPFQAVNVAAYPPATTFFTPLGQQFMQVTGDLILRPTISKSFAQPSMFQGTTVALTFNVANPNTATALSGVAFTDTLPAGLLVATPNGLTSSCSGTVTAVAGSNSISLSGANLAASASCSITVTVAASFSGPKVNTTSTLTSDQAAPGAAATASILVFLTADNSFQVSYAANPAGGESFVNIINTGANGAPILGPGFGGAAGNICANVYAFSPDEQLVSCCSCLITPNAVVNLGVNRDLTIKTLTGVVPSSVTIKLVSTLAGDGTGTSCSNSAASSTTTLATGMVAYGTTPQSGSATAGPYDIVEHRFTPATLSAGERASITGRCAAILGNGSGFGVCKSCQPGALGGDKK